jgi:hypothetical protein
VQRATGGVEAVREDIAELEAELGSETEKMAASYDPGAIALEPHELSPRKGDLAVEPPVLLWVPAL